MVAEILRGEGDVTTKTEVNVHNTQNNTNVRITQHKRTTQMSVATILRGVTRRSHKEECGPRAFHNDQTAPSEASHSTDRTLLDLHFTAAVAPSRALNAARVGARLRT